MTPARRTMRLALPALALPLLVHMPGHAGGADLFPFGDSEKSCANDARLPAGWAPSAGKGTSSAWVAEGARSGTRCLRMTNHGVQYGHANWRTDDVAVKPCMAYRVEFFFKARGGGVPCFSLDRIKGWRLFKGDTKGEWVRHADVVTVPPGVTKTHFRASNYNRKDKVMWLDDLSMVELPLSESPLTARLGRAKRAAGALDRNLARLTLTNGQRKDLASLRDALARAEAAYARLGTGEAGPEDFERMDSGLEGVEKAVGAYLLTVWTISPEEWARRLREPTAVGRSADVRLTASPGETLRLYVGLMCLVDEGLAARVGLAGDRRAGGWEPRVLALVLAAPADRARAGDAGSWAGLDSLGQIFLPAGVPRYLMVEMTPPETMPGEYTFALGVHALDRPAESACVTLGIRAAD